MSESKPKEAPVQYRVTVHLLQVMAHNPEARTSPGVLEDTNRHFWRGDVLPSWVPAESIAHYLEVNAIEVAS